MRSVVLFSGKRIGKLMTPFLLPRCDSRTRLLGSSERFIRCAHSVNDNDIHFDSNWPKDNQPKSPYSLFELTESNFTKALLKKRFHELARLYHPDHSSNRTILKRNNSTELTSSNIHDNVLSTSDKSDRFKIIKEAYELLKDPGRKHQYDMLGLGWVYGPKPIPTASGMPRYERHEKFYNAGTWEDYSNIRRNDKEEVGPLSMLIWFFGIFAIVELTSLLSRLEESINKRDFAHDETEKHLTLAYINYGLDEDKWSRLRRFLWFRTYSLYRTKEDLDREAKKNENMIKDLKKKEET
ncbi:Jid1p [Kluyveromyces lactis]|uniref:KLLA0B08459p n=1 Tax=Kluyveromyces lactis (strain ATCC 8585 / CBS 2359 / DSM 70799 / NBRC 1267 / NRRL Y-1140 / WM37) TaxID=284590 RepID=Q6CVY4_KLULA|nr:uncharacterized protein KLLA0_B08459g [Kluyveromyces lactis]CAH02298.1 KLLA0B08459p [Kluyveromyces lactis]|eukprot:XP_451905.1 uncharacterized protein KLLA0_B08459g [Kluyveromyces lactis]